MTKLASVWGDGMVLQRQAPCSVWGTTDSPRPPVVTVAGVEALVSLAEWRWCARWDSLAPGGPFALTLDGEVAAFNVWIGDVWLCAGQSNMERNLEAGAPWPDDVQALAGDPAIRQLCLPNQFDFSAPRDDIPGARWIGADTEVGKISAAGFAFARDLRARTGVPQGLILVAVGGSAAQAWLSPKTLQGFPRYAAEVRRFAEPGFLARLAEEEGVRQRQWYEALEAADPKDAARAGSGEWLQGAPDPGPGSAWFRRRFSLDAVPAAEGRLILGTLVDADEVWVNGVSVGSTAYQYPLRRYRVPPAALKVGTNEILVRLVAPQGGLKFTPGKRRALDLAGRSVPLEDGWETRPGASLPLLPPATFFPLVSLGLFYGMLAPLSGYAFRAVLGIRAVLWYQGESNVGDPSDYQVLMERLVEEWRGLFHNPQLPFLMVQLPLFSVPMAYEASGWAWLRDLQRRAAAQPFGGLVVAVDAGEWNDIHPADKTVVGQRLALAARHLVYGEALDPWTGPLVAGAASEGTTVRLTFTQTGSSLATADGGPLGGFFVAGLDGVFSPCRARIDGTTVVLEPPAGPPPTTVRYAWASNPAGANLVNDQGLPAAAFELSIT